MSCGLIGGPAAEEAINGLTTVQSFASEAVDRMVYASDALQDFLTEVSPLISDVSLDDIGALSYPFQRGLAPTAPNLDLDVPGIDYDPSLVEVQFEGTSVAPGPFTKVAPELNLPATPEALTVEAPTGAPTVVERDMPTAPDDEIPDLPTLTSITIPALPALSFPEFTATAPDALQELSIPELSWSETAYSFENKTEVSAQISAILGGSTGIPDAIWEMVWARSGRQIRQVARKAREDAEEYWANKGHFLPTGALRQRVREAGLVEVEQLSDLARAQAIEDSKIYVERLNNALAQGIALEGVLIGLHNDQARRSLEAAKFVIDTAGRLADLRVSVYNAQVAGFLQKAQAFDVQVRAELAQLEKTKIELEAQKLVGTLNLQRLETYKAQISGIQTKYALFSDQVKAVVAQYDGDRTRVEAFGELVKVFESQQKAKEIEWRGYGEAVRGEAERVNVFKIEADAYLAKVQGYKAGTDADVAVMDAKLRGEGQKLERLKIALDKFRTVLEGDVQRISSLEKTFNSEVRVWEGEGRLEEMRVRSDDQRFDLLLRNAQIKATIEGQNLTRNIAHTEKLYDLQFNSINTGLEANTQIGSSALAALNFAATISDSVSNSSSCSQNYSY